MTDEIIEQISDVERIIKTKNLIGKQMFCHQWFKEKPFELWVPCCNPSLEKDGVEFIKKDCPRYCNISKILKLEGQDGMIKRINK